ncbi:hypothetical protein GBM52_13685 [Enterococcus faecium]|uniref:Uncharacterized protein n=2 Tax=Enterococcus faecium TaxID=1352 RepID=A0A5P3FXP8_ENTFC|nr:hypothetical protein GBM46_13265 [Enterococcus faecium]KAB7577758.1 hypothetical protein GBM73_10710 [Enterococcus faecium]KAB7590423.1 hypothetical protein GBM52_13685 [Enterococcus faecium]KAB7594235.1 hypothetical protein GBM82_13745 [Enterococcus faecium]KAB7596980.1 hypothetical protein GBM65_13040 [Enterococcus faecium]
MFSAKNIVLLTEINGFFDASLLHNYMDVIFFAIHHTSFINWNNYLFLTKSLHFCQINKKQKKFHL